MATLLNFVRMSGWQFQSADKARFKEPMQLATIMFLSYFFGSVIDYFVNLKELISYYHPNSYYFFLDILTALLISIVVKVRSKQGQVCKFYLLCGLLFNASLFLIIQIEIFLIYEGFKPYEHWWLWYMFSIGINSSDAMMVLVLILQKDFFRLYLLSRKIRECF
ncbi:hypothetical protein CWB72_00160 [Pseudoalteromonas phenolica]|uniref:hypothetical protein n=1 Tax=Pseudoalteromonas phenolica TaxID=161398 RepID=UPI00110BC0EF|nr:hypothetical protein [Pseudoalteromonas phenolica]TMN93930.1 hypothetical protein CWB72_00160 [Pseudoalteromonas phenolica]